MTDIEMFKLLYRIVVPILKDTKTKTDYGISTLNIDKDSGLYKFTEEPEMVYSFSCDHWSTGEKSVDLELFSIHHGRVAMICGVRVYTKILEDSPDLSIYQIGFNKHTEYDSYSTYSIKKNEAIRNELKMYFNDVHHSNSKTGVTFDELSDEFLFQLSVGYDYPFNPELTKEFYNTVMSDDEINQVVLWSTNKNSDILIRNFPKFIHELNSVLHKMGVNLTFNDI